MDLKGAQHFLALFATNPKEAATRIIDAPQGLMYFREMSATFFWQAYYELYQSIKPNTTVLDLGAFIGNSAIYFAMHPNVKQVISYEASPQACSEFQRNITLSQLKRKITIYNLTVNITPGYVKNTRKSPTGENKTISHSSGIKTITLTEILSKLKPPIAIKCDIEGSEKDIFKTDLKKVYAIELEYHNNLGAELSKDLNTRGFKTQFIRAMPKEGFIFAYR